MRSVIVGLTGGNEISDVIDGVMHKRMSLQLDSTVKNGCQI